MVRKLSGESVAHEKFSYDIKTPDGGCVFGHCQGAKKVFSVRYGGAAHSLLDATTHPLHMHKSSNKNHTTANALAGAGQHNGSALQIVLPPTFSLAAVSLKATVHRQGAERDRQAPLPRFGRLRQKKIGRDFF